MEFLLLRHLQYPPPPPPAGGLPPPPDDAGPPPPPPVAGGGGPPLMAGGPVPPVAAVPPLLARGPPPVAGGHPLLTGGPPPVTGGPPPLPPAPALHPAGAPHNCETCQTTRMDHFSCCVIVFLLDLQYMYINSKTIVLELDQKLLHFGRLFSLAESDVISGHAHRYFQGTDNFRRYHVSL